MKTGYQTNFGGDLDVLRDVTNPRRIVLGRTGSGKTALLMQFKSEEQDRVIAIKPESLALNYISNSNILNFVLDLGVSLDIFFRLPCLRNIHKENSDPVQRRIRQYCRAS